MKCPGCGKEIQYCTSNPDRPFCSEKCRMVDLGGWFNEQYAVPDQYSSPDDEFIQD